MHLAGSYCWGVRYQVKPTEEGSRARSGKKKTHHEDGESSIARTPKNGTGASEDDSVGEATAIPAADPAEDPGIQEQGVGS